MPDKKRIRINVDADGNDDWLKTDKEREICARVVAGIETTNKGKATDNAADPTPA